MDLVTLVREAGADKVVLLLIALVLLAFARTIQGLIRRGSKSEETVNKIALRQQEQLEEAQDDITETTRERWTLIAKIAQLELERDNLKNMLRNSGISGGMSTAEENVLRQMIVSQQKHIHQLQDQLKECQNET